MTSKRTYSKGATYTYLSINKTTILNQLQHSNLYARCPNCEGEFKLSSATLFDGLGEFPDIAEKKQSEWFEDLKTRAEELKQRKVSVDVRSEKMAIAAGLGKIIEKVLPAYRQFNQPIADCRALFEPVDLIIFKGCCNSKVDSITFMDIKTGDGRLSKHQRAIRDVVEKKKVRCEVV